MKLQTPSERAEERQREHNRKSKMVVKLLGENLTYYICILIPILLVGLIWTDSGFPKFGKGLISDGIITILLFIIAENAMNQIGVSGGKLDDEYNNIHKEYIKLTDEVMKKGTALMESFCLWQIDAEYSSVIRRKCKEIKVDFNDYINKYSKMSFEDLKKIFSAQTATKIFAINKIKPIELTPEIILTDGKPKNTRGGVPIGGEEYSEIHTKSLKHISIAIITAAVTVSFTFMLTKDISFGRIVYTLMKLTVLFMRMNKGYTSGAKAYNTVEIKHIRAKMLYENMYLEYLDKKIYKNFGDKYGNINEMIGESYEEKLSETF